MMKLELTANNINAAPDAMPQKRLSFATAEQWHDCALTLARRQTATEQSAANGVEAQS